MVVAFSLEEAQNVETIAIINTSVAKIRGGSSRDMKDTRDIHNIIKLKDLVHLAFTPHSHLLHLEVRQVGCRKTKRMPRSRVLNSNL